MFALYSLIVCVAVSVPVDIELLDFSAPGCGPCQEMKPVIQRLESQGLQVKHIDIVENPTTARRFSVSSVPCFVVLVNGEEVDRHVGATTYERLLQMSHSAPGKRPNLIPSTPAGGMASHASPEHHKDRRSPWEIGIGRTDGLAPVFSQRSNGLDDLNARTISDSFTASRQCGIDATVRIRIKDLRSISYGSGTVVDVHKDEALVLTCGHIFRDSQGKGQIMVDLFREGRHLSVMGQLIGYNLDRDLGLVSIRPGIPLTPVQVAFGESVIRSGMRVFTVGCNRGGTPSLQTTRIASIDKFLGWPNIQTETMPVDGCSGGGLFTDRGLLIGVCNAADPVDRQGLYSSFQAIHTQLDQVGLSFVYQRQKTIDSSSPDKVAREIVQEPLSLPVKPDTFASTGEEVSRASRPDDQAHAVLEAIGRHGDSAEVICIVRSRTQPVKSSQVFFIENVSSTFVERLANQLPTRPQAQPTGFHVKR